MLDSDCRCDRCRDRHHRDSIIIVGLSGWLIDLDWKLTLRLVITPVVAIAIHTINRSYAIRAVIHNVPWRISHSHRRECRRSQGSRNYSGGQDYEQRRFTVETNGMRRHTMKQAAAAAANVPLVQLVAALALAIIIYLVFSTG